MENTRKPRARFVNPTCLCRRCLVLGKLRSITTPVDFCNRNREGAGHGAKARQPKIQKARTMKSTKMQTGKSKRAIPKGKSARVYGGNRLKEAFSSVCAVFSGTRAGNIWGGNCPRRLSLDQGDNHTRVRYNLEPEDKAQKIQNAHKIYCLGQTLKIQQVENNKIPV